MILNVASIIALASFAVAVPFKRYDNATETSLSSSVEVDTTITIDKYVTITLPYTTLTLEATASDMIASADEVASSAEATITGNSINSSAQEVSVVTIYSTLTVFGSAIVTPIATSTSIVDSQPTTTSTITHFITVTEANGSVTTAAVTQAACIPSTVTVTKTETERESVKASSNSFELSTITETVATSYPVVATFAISDFTTTVTSYVDVTSYLTIVSSWLAETTAAVNATSHSYRRLRRGLIFDF